MLRKDAGKTIQKSSLFLTWQTPRCLYGIAHPVSAAGLASLAQKLSAAKCLLCVFGNYIDYLCSCVCPLWWCALVLLLTKGNGNTAVFMHGAQRKTVMNLIDATIVSRYIIKMGCYYNCHRFSSKIFHVQSQVQ